MQKKKVLFISHEFEPYNNETDMSAVLNQLAVLSNSEGYEVRCIMPRFGTINERRHKLHEVVRLSGINITVDREDYPLIIKVASLPNARLQMYFMDNEDMFKRKRLFHDAEGEFFEDNAERMIFFCKGAIETVKKFGWPPDIIFIHGWLGSLIPMLIKKQFKDEPVFANSQIIYSIPKNTIKEKLGKEFIPQLLSSTSIKEKTAETFKAGDNASLMKAGAKYADVVYLMGNDVDKTIASSIKTTKSKKVLKFQPDEDDIASIVELYAELAPDEVEEE
jgi:starch synthase